MNIVFDLGGVLLSWNPQQLIASVFSDSNIQRCVYKQVYQHEDWFQLDKGTLELDEAINRAVIRTGQSKEKISEFMNKVPQALVLIPETVALIKKIRNNAEHKLFILSNMHTASIEYLEKTYTFWNLFDGIVISSRVLLAKPEIEIYLLMQKIFQIDLSESVFIDDTQINLTSAEAVGMKTILFENSKQCEKKLKRFGCN